jgi:dipeptide transport system ATP-binding protein
MNALLEVRNLRVEFGPKGKAAVAVDGVDLVVGSGERVAIVGESGSGKSVSMLAMMGLVDAPGRVSADALRFDGQDLLGLSPRARRAIVGKDIAMIFQDAQSSLNPSYTVGYQLMEAMRTHLGLRGAALHQRAVELLELVEIPDPLQRMAAYPHQLSGGMNQRVMIAMALSCEPRLLIADEPTTALDVTVQAQIMELLLKLQQEQGMALLLITHDLALVAEMARDVNVMYAGQIMESATVEQLFSHPAHPYTHALLAALPEHNRGKARLATLGGVIPGTLDRPAGCLLAPRCMHADAQCRASRPMLAGGVRCFHPQGQA